MAPVSLFFYMSNACTLRRHDPYTEKRVVVSYMSFYYYFPFFSLKIPLDDLFYSFKKDE